MASLLQTNFIFTNHDSENYPPNHFQQHTQQPSHSNTNFSILAIAIIGIIATAFLLVSYYVFVIKCCLNWHRFSHRFPFLRSFSETRTQNSTDPLVFYVTPTENRGLDESAIRAIPVFRFKKEDTKDANDCSVCLSEFCEGERLKIIPNCSHFFHIDCIDTWLQTNSNCPLCRSNIENPADPITVIHIPSAVPDQTNDGPAQETDRNDHSSILPQQMDIIRTHVSPATSKLEPGLEQRRFMNQISPSSSKSCSKFHRQGMRSSMGDECIDVREKDEQFSIQPIRRSFSMDSSVDRQLYITVQEILAQNSQLQEVSSSEECSSRVRRSFFSFGTGRGSRNAVLPIRDDSKL